ncbi:hypothetical protein DYB35_009728 [Aphanomyces astaci]|uniref:Secreted protein n=1 Tax=Aphanomyces astaci TaxID=112090 RepID=A0A3R6XHK7_APHAT|nr:hypothetical protein DYB35_009728 [Aphanomyces astaci]
MVATFAMIVVMVAAPFASLASADASDDCFSRVKMTLNANASLVASRSNCFVAAVYMTSEAYFASKPDDNAIDVVAANANCTKWFNEMTAAFRAIDPPCAVQNPPDATFESAYSRKVLYTELNEFPLAIRDLRVVSTVLKVYAHFFRV